MVQARRLHDLCEIRSGGTPRRGMPEFYGGEIPWAKISDMGTANGRVDSTEESISPAGLAAIGGRLFPCGSILLAMYGSVGKTAVAGTDLATNQAILGLQVKDPEELHPGYLLRWLESIQPQLLNDARGVTQKNISATLVRELCIPVPTVAEQRHIAAILDKADAIRRKRQEAIALTDELLRSFFLDMFGDLVTNEKGWDTVSLGEAAERVTVGHVGPTSQWYRDVGTPLLRTQNVGQLTVKYDGLRHVAPEFAGTLEKSRLREGDVIISRVISDEVRCAVVPADLDGANCANIVVVRPGARLRPHYLACLILSRFGQRRLLGARVGSAQSVVNTTSFKKWLIPVPDISSQKDFESLARRVAAMKTSLQASSDLLDNLFASLSQRAFRGEL